MSAGRARRVSAPTARPRGPWWPGGHATAAATCGRGGGLRVLRRDGERRSSRGEGRRMVAQLMAGSDRCSLFSRLSACLRTIFEQTSGFPNFCMRLCSLQLSGGAWRWQWRRGGGGAGGARRDGGAAVERRAGSCCGGAAWSLALFFVWFYGCFVVWGLIFLACLNVGFLVRLGGV